MSSLKTRLENLEKKLFTDNENLPDCIIITAENGRLNSEPDTSKIVRFTTNNEIYDIEPLETEETFVMRAADAAKAKLPAKGVPCLIAITENMLKGSCVES